MHKHILEPLTDNILRSVLFHFFFFFFLHFTLLVILLWKLFLLYFSIALCMRLHHLSFVERSNEMPYCLRSSHTCFTCNVYNVCVICVCLNGVCLPWSLCVCVCERIGNRKANSVNSNLMSSLKICLGQKTDSDNQITADRMLEIEITGGILSNYSVSEL